MTWYAVAHREDADPKDRVWTLSQDPVEPGWTTDSGFSGYGMTKATAEFFARIANEKKTEGKCVWRQDRDGAWDTACGGKFEFTDAGPQENRAKFCLYCGKLLVERAANEKIAR